MRPLTSRLALLVALVAAAGCGNRGPDGPTLDGTSPEQNETLQPDATTSPPTSVTPPTQVAPVETVEPIATEPGMAPAAP